MRRGETMLPTPSTSHVSYDLIYEPAEDSYLFLDTLSSAPETAWLHSRFSPTLSSSVRPATAATAASPTPLLVEIGPGSGVVVAFLTAHAATIFGRDVLSLSVDVNPYACRATRTTVEKALAETRAGTTRAGATYSQKEDRTEEKNEAADGGEDGDGDGDGRSTYLSSLNGDLASPLRPGEVDVLVFNPPYVPTESVPVAPVTTDTTTTPAPLTSSSPSAPSRNPPGPTFEDQSRLLALSYAGGLDGMEVTSRLLRQIPELLSPRGVAYVLFCRGNRPDEVKGWIRGWHEQGHEQGQGRGVWRAETVGTSGKTAGWEKLEIVRIWRE